MSCFRTDGGTQTVRFNSNCECEKTVTVDYSYYSHAKVTSGTRFLVCDREAKIKIEDYAILFRTGEFGNASEINSGIALVSSVCKVEKDTNFISDINDITNILGSVVQSGVKASQIIDGAGTISDFFNQRISQIGVCSMIDTTYTLINGKDTFTLNSLERSIKIDLLSRANFEGQAKGNAYLEGAINSAFYLAAILETDEYSDLCCDEKIAAYALGTLDGFPIDGDGIPNNMSQGILKNLSDLQEETVGAFYGQYTPWGGNFDSTGCCDDVDIECTNQCVYFRVGDCKNVDSFNNAEIENRASELLFSDIVTIYPIPQLQGESIYLELKDKPIYIEIVDMDGKVLFSKMQEYDDYHKIALNTQNLSTGIYFVRCTFEGKTTVNKFVIN